MSDLLSRICAEKRLHVADCKARRPMAELAAAAQATPPPRGFAARLTAAAATGYGLIAEIKRASPSRGLIRADFDPQELARAFQRAGAACLSVLTDSPYFQGSDEDLAAVREAVDLPILRKDFMVDPYQVVETRALGADCVLLIMAAVDDRQARELTAAAAEVGLDVLAEVHDQAEMERAAALETGAIGINNRNLSTLEVDLATTEKLAPLAPGGRLIVSESGLKSPADLDRMSRAGVDCFLIGETLMRRDDVEAAARSLLARPQSAHAGA